MPTLIPAPTRIAVPGNKKIDEYVGRVNTSSADVSVAHMRSPQGWQEPAQTPEFREITIVLRGLVRVEHREGTVDVSGGQAIITEPGERIRYSTPSPEGAEYIAICLPAFAVDQVHREEA